MGAIGVITLLLIAANIIFSYRGFTNHAFYKRYAFGVDKVLLQKDYKVLVTSGFLHVNWLHLLFNMLSLYFFSGSLEASAGEFYFVLIYFVSLIGGNLFSLFVHRNHGDYKAVGASGAVCGIIFASIAIFPGMEVSLFFLPIFVPGWLYGILFVILSIYAIRSKADNIGHEAHLAGALAGLVTAVLLFPAALRFNYVTILLIFIPCATFIYIIIRKPGILHVDNHYFKKHNPPTTIDDRYNLDKRKKQQELDRILEKIHRSGMNSLTKREKDFLNSSR